MRHSLRLSLLAFCFLMFVSVTNVAQGLLNPISYGRFEIGNTQAAPCARYTGKIASLWPNGNTTYGSGVLVGQKHVLTAAHNLYYKAFGGWARAVLFAPAVHGNVYPFSASYSDRQIVHSYWIKGLDSALISEKNYDFGVMHLKKPLGDYVSGWMSLTAWPDTLSSRLNLNGYDADVFGGWHQITRSITSIHSIFDWPLAPNTRYSAGWYAAPGSSGGPVWYRDESGRCRVVGVSTSTNEHVTSSTGIELTYDFYQIVRAFVRTYP